MTCIVNENTNVNLAIEAYSEYVLKSKNKGKDTALVIVHYYQDSDEHISKIDELKNLAKDLKISNNLMFLSNISVAEK